MSRDAAKKARKIFCSRAGAKKARKIFAHAKARRREGAKKTARHVLPLRGNPRRG